MYDSRPKNDVKKHSTFQDFLSFTGAINHVCSQSDEQAFEVCSFPGTRATPINVMGVTGMCQEKN